jgi:predicted MFS family arabinose efflux permease
MIRPQNLKKYGTLLGLYVAQAIPMSFFATVVPVIMRQDGYSLESIGYLQLVKLPWIMKFLWAPFIDRKSRNRSDYRRWIVLSELFYAMVILSIGFFDLETNFTTIIVLMLIAFTASATQDIATDAFAILSLKSSERSVGNSMQSTGSFIGTLAGSGLLLMVYHLLGWQWLLVALAGFVMLSVLPVMAYKKESLMRQRPKPAQAVSLKAIVSFFQQKAIWKQVLLLVFFYSGIIGILTMIKPFLVDVGYDVMEIGMMSGVYGTLVAAGMALITGAVARHLSRQNTLMAASFMAVIAAAYFVWLGTIQPETYHILTGIAFIWGAYGAATVIVYTVAMDAVRPGLEGTDFTLQIVLTHLSSLIIAIASGKLADTFGYQGLFVTELVLALVVFLSISFLFQKQKKKAYATTS